MDKVKRTPTLPFALATLLTLVLFIVLGLTVFKMPVITVLFFSWLILVPFAFKLGFTTKEVEESVYEMIKVGVGLFALLLAIGCLVSIWLCAGTVPTLIYWGLNLITPKFFLLIAFLVCTFVSLPTGTSWGTISTAGVAMMGVGLGLGLPGGMVAGAIASGAYVGDKLSPVSDTPLLTSTVCGVPLMKHIKHMLYSAIPAFVLTAILFVVLGFKYAGTSLDTASLTSITSALSDVFRIGWVTLIPLIIVIALLVMRQSAIGSIMVGCAVGILIAILYQGYGLTEIGNFLAYGFTVKTGNKLLDPILNRGGISSMMELIGVVVASLGMGGILKGTGILNTLVEALGKVIKTKTGLTIATAAECSLCVALVGANYFSMVMVGTLMTPLYKKLKFRPENASRIINDFSSCGSMFIPYNIGAIFVASTLGVPILAVLPFALFHIIVMGLDVVYGLVGFSMPKYTDEEWKDLQANEAALTAEKSTAI
jgi:NhaC family Na+:H+ antiporter